MEGLATHRSRKLSDIAKADAMKADAHLTGKQGEVAAADPAGGDAAAEIAMKDSEKPPRKETKEEREMKRRQKEEEREKKRKREEEERDRKRKKKEEAEAKKKAEEEEKEQKRRKREEEKEKKRQQEEEEKAKKQREKEERLEKKRQEEEERARKVREREEKLEKKRQEEEEKEQRRNEAEQKAKAANRKSVDFMSRFLGKPAAKPAAEPQPAAAPTGRAPVDCAASPSTAAESGEPGPVCSAPKTDRGASPDAALDDCGDDATSTTNAHAQRAAGPASAAARLRKDAGRLPRLFLPPPDSVFAHSTCARALEPVNPSVMDRELAVHWKDGPCVAANVQPRASTPSLKEKGANNTEAHLGAVPEAEAEGTGDAAALTGEVPAPASCGSQATAGVAVGASSATALPEGCGEETLIRHFMSHFCRRRARHRSSSRNSGAGTSSRFMVDQSIGGNNWRLRRLPKQVPGIVQSSPLKKQGSSAVGANAKGTKVTIKAKGDGRQGEGEDEEEDDELWSLMGTAARQSSADDDVMELAPQSSGDAEDGKAQSTLAGKGRKRRVKKLLQFHDNLRPAYYGTHSMTSSAVTARRPLAKEPILEYDVDSDEEWEDIPDDQGESLSDSDGEEEDQKEGRAQGEGDGEEDEEEDGFVVPDGYLSDDEGVEHGPKAKPPGEQAEDAGRAEAKDEATHGGGEGAGPRKDVAAPAETAAEAKQRRLQLLEKAVQRALRCGRPVIISALRTPSAPVQVPAGRESLTSQPGPAGSGPPGAVGDAAASSAAASAKAQLEYLQALSIEVVTPGVVVTVPPAPLAAAADERPLGGPSKKPKQRHQPSPASQQQQQQQQGQTQPGSRTPLQGPLPAHRFGPGRPGAGNSPGTAPPHGGPPPLPMPGGERQPLPGTQFGINPPAPCTPNAFLTAKEAPAGCPVSPVCLDGSPCEHPGHQAKPITSFFLKRTQGMGPQDGCPVDGGLALT